MKRLILAVLAAGALSACTTTAPLGPIGALPPPVTLPAAGALAVHKAQASVRILHTTMLELRDTADKAGLLNPTLRAKVYAATRRGSVSERAVQAVLDLGDTVTASTLNAAVVAAANAIADAQALIPTGAK